MHYRTANMPQTSNIFHKLGSKKHNLPTYTFMECAANVNLHLFWSKGGQSMGLKVDTAIQNNDKANGMNHKQMSNMKVKMTATAQNLEVKDVFLWQEKFKLLKMIMLHFFTTCYTAATIRDNGRLQHVINSA